MEGLGVTTCAMRKQVRRTGIQLTKLSEERIQLSHSLNSILKDRTLPPLGHRTVNVCFSRLRMNQLIPPLCKRGDGGHKWVFGREGN